MDTRANYMNRIITTPQNHLNCRVFIISIQLSETERYIAIYVLCEYNEPVMNINVLLAKYML